MLGPDGKEGFKSFWRKSLPGFAPYIIPWPSLFVRFSRLLPHSVSAGALAAVVTSLSNVLLVRMYLQALTREEFGLWSLALVFYVAAQQVAVSFIPALVKAIAETIHTGQESVARSYVVTCASLTLLTPLALIPFASFVTSASGSAFRVPLKFMGIWVTLIPIVWILASVYLTGEILLSYITAHGKITWTHGLNSIAIAFSVMTSMLLFRMHSAVINIPLGLLTGRLLLLAISAVLVVRLRLGRISRPDFQLRNIAVIGRMGYLYFAGALLSLGLYPLSKTLLVRSAGLSAVAAFEIAYTFSLQLRNVIDVAMRGILPEVVRINAKAPFTIHSTPDPALAALLKRYTLLALSASVAISGAGYILSPVFFAIINAHFGSSLQGILGLLLIGGCLNAIGIPHFYTLLGLGKGLSILMSYVILAATNILALAVFVALSNATETGAAWAVLLSMFTSTCYLMFSSATFVGWRFSLFRRADPAANVD